MLTYPYIKREICIGFIFNLFLGITLIILIISELTANLLECDSTLTIWFYILCLLNSLGILPKILTIYKLYSVN